MKFKTINTLSRYSIILTQFVLILLSWLGIAAIWARVEQVAIAAQEAQSRSEWAAAVISDWRSGK